MIKIIDVKEMLAQALIEIARQKPVDKITVTDIVNRCNTSRRTFYNHFIDKYELISWVYTSRVEKILSCFENSDTWEKCMYMTYQTLLDNQDYFSMVIDHEGQNSFYQTFVTHTYDYMRDIIFAKLGIPTLPEEIDYALTAHVFGQVNCAMKWLHEGTVISPQQMAAYNVMNMPEIIREYFLEGNQK